MYRLSLPACLVLFLCGLSRAVALDSDGAFAPPMDRLYDNRIQVECAEYLSVNLFNVQVDPQWANEPSHFTIISTDDEAYAPGKQVHPLASGSRTRAVRVAQRKDLLVKQTAIFLQLPSAMKNGKKYAVAFADGAPTLPPLAAVLCDDTRQINDNLRVNQLGYIPGYAKRAYFGQYMGSLGGSLGGMPLKVQTFDLLNEQGKSVFAGRIVPRNAGDDLVGQIVYEMDFSGWETPGTYQLHVSGVGLSYPFEIGKSAMNPLYVNAMRGQYHQRCGMAIDPAFSRFARPACHLDDAYLEQKVEKLGFVKPKRPPFYATNYDGQQHPAIHGHHDAGDYGKYTVSGAAYVFSALNAMRVFPDKFQEDDLGLPYSDNGVPDLVEECKWELDWLENMQDPSDGGVFGIIKPNNGGYESGLPLPEAHRLFYPKDTVFTGAFAGALAEAARSPVLRKYYPADCDRYLAKAIKAWQFLEQNKNYVEYFGYGASFGDWDERCWAAVELYAATGDQKYHDYFLSQFDPSRKIWDWKPLVECVGYAVDTYVFLKDRPRDPAMLARCQSALRDACATLLNDSVAYPYRLSVPQPVIKSGMYGWMFPGDFAGYDLLMGYAMDKDARYLQCALDNLSYECGTNPSGYFLQTGLGFKRNIEAVSQQSEFDHIVEPVAGLPLGIGTPGFYWLNRYGKKVGEGEYPQKWPLMNRWYDGFNVHSEFTTGPMMRETLVAGYFADIAGRDFARPTVKIVADQVSGVAPLSIRFHADAHAARESHIRQVFWDFDDESFSTLTDPVHVFAAPGREQTIAVTVLDEDGRSAYDTMRIRALAENPPYPTTRPNVDADTELLYHLDGNLADAAGHGSDLKPVAGAGVERADFSFRNDGPGWMAKPSGAYLWLDGKEQFVVTIPHGLIPDPAHSSLSVDVMLYLREFAGWGFPGNPMLLGLQGDRSDFGWRQETWDRAMAPHFGKAISSSRFAAEFPRERWCQVKLTYNGGEQATMWVDGHAWGRIDGTLSSSSGALQLVVGPFRGMLSELRLLRQDSTRSAQN